MRYFVTLSGSELPIDVTALPSGAYDVQLDGRHVDADVVVLPDALSVRIGHRVLDLTVEGKPPRIGAVGGGIRAYVDVESERQRAAAAASSGPRGSDAGSIVSPMPGRIVKVLVKQGAEVESGDPVVVVEAMKMENELRAPRAGSIAKILVKEGDRVEGGAVLVELGE